MKTTPRGIVAVVLLLVPIALVWRYASERSDRGRAATRLAEGTTSQPTPTLAPAKDVLPIADSSASSAEPLVRGRVVDRQGHAIAGARVLSHPDDVTEVVTLTDASGPARAATTDARGRFELPLSGEPLSWSLVAEAHGFSPWSVDAVAALRREGYVFRGKITPISNMEMEVIFKRLVLDAVADDPAWYARILARRVVATVLQTRLWPREAQDGYSWALNSHPSEGHIEYYFFTRTADWFGVGRRWYELPLPVLWLPLLALCAAALWPTARARLCARSLAPIGVVALAAMASPVLVTTASGPETQAFLFVYLLAAGSLVDGALRSRLRADTPSSAC